MSELTEETVIRAIGDFFCPWEASHEHGCPGDKIAREWLAEVKAQAHQAERENIIGYLQSEIKVANEWCEEYKKHCTPDDEIRNSTVVATYKNLVETLIANPYRQGEN